MDSDSILHLLIQRGDYLSGEEMSATLGVTRAAVWKGISALREAGYVISSAPRLGYRLEHSPDRLSAGAISARLPAGILVGRQVQCLEQVDSTNTYLKKLGAEGAPAGLAVLAEEQTAGRGRRDRRFQSPRGAGLYLSVLLRPACLPAEAVDLTAWIAVAVCDGIEELCGIRPQIKWTNDIILHRKKLCGVLTEMSVEGETGALQSVVAGMGVNVSQTAQDFAQAGLGEIATSLTLEGCPVDRNELAAALLRALDRMARAFPAAHADYLARYRADCVTLGRDVTLLRPSGPVEGRAVAVGDDFSLEVAYPDGSTEAVSSGEVSVRGIGGYL